MEKKRLGDPEQFINDVLLICAQHNLSIAHEDTQGAFIIEPFKTKNTQWLKEAMISEEVKE